MTKLGTTDLDISPLCLGGNVFGWTAGEQESAAVLDAYLAAGGNFVDTADRYAGGRSEEIVGRWMTARSNRDDVIVATKVGMKEGAANLKATTIRTAAEGSLRSLQTDVIDLYYAHRDDPNTPLEETLGAFDALVHEGKVRHVAASNYSAPRLAEALAVSDREGLARYVVLQPHYNLLERDEYEGELAELCAREGLACLTYCGLAGGFLTGKYRAGGPEVDSPRAADASMYLDDRGIGTLTVLDELAAAHSTTVAAVALAWLIAQPTVASAIASARNPEQLAGIVPAMDLKLTAGELERLSTAASR